MRPESRDAGRCSNGELLNLFLTKAAPEFRRGGHTPDDELEWDEDELDDEDDEELPVSCSQ